MEAIAQVCFEPLPTAALSTANRRPILPTAALSGQPPPYPLPNDALSYQLPPHPLLQLQTGKPCVSGCGPINIFESAGAALFTDEGIIGAALVR